MDKYSIAIYPLAEEDGGGYAAVFPDLPGCMSDGDTPEKALENAQDAFAAWMGVQKERDVDIPKPGAAVNDIDKEQREILDALRTTAAYADAANVHIQRLENFLQDILSKMDEGWRVSGVAIANSAARKRQNTPIH